MIKQLKAEEGIMEWAITLGRRAKKGRAKLLKKIGLL